MPVPFRIGNLASHPPRETLRVRATGEFLADTYELTFGASLSRLVVHHETLAPGRRASRPHSHTQREEIVLVLAGRPQVRIDDELHQLEAGDYVVFPAGTGVAHVLENDASSTTIAVYLLIASAGHDDEIVPGAE